MLAYCVFNASSAAVSLYQPLLSRWQLNSLKTRASDVMKRQICRASNECISPALATGRTRHLQVAGI